MILRPYQTEAHDAALSKWKEISLTTGVMIQSTLVVLPTGCGKTVMAAHIIKTVLADNPGKRVMCIAHREELIFQGAAAIERVTGEKVAIEMADQWSDEHALFGKARVVFATVQTLATSRGGRMQRFKRENFCLLWIDEFHHAVADTYQKVIDHFCTGNPSCKLLGVTATPDRADEEALGQVCESVAFDFEILDAISGGWLVPIKARSVFVDGLDFSQVRTTAGDLNGADLAEVMESEANLHEVVTPVIELAGDKKTLIFAVTVAQAERMSEIFNRHKAGCSRIVSGGTPKDERRQMLADYKAGKFNFLCNVGVATEGFDEPGIELVVMARPTKSRSLFAQMAGRGMRPLPGLVDSHNTAEARKTAIEFSAKPHMVILDFVGNAGRHKLMTVADILGGTYPDEVVDAVNAKRKKGQGELDVAAELEAATAEIAESKRRAIKAKAKVRTEDINPFDVFDIKPAREKAWHRGRKPTDRMVEVLLNIGVTNPANLSFTEASQLIQTQMERRAKGLCTLKQARLLMKYGYESSKLTFAEAGDLLTKLKNNGWKPLAQVA